MSTDRELLELAANAAGYRVIGSHAEKGLALDDESTGYWNPLTDDGDALRLAAKLELDVMHRVVSGRRIEVLAAGGRLIKHFYDGDTAAAMRRAIVLTAADIGAHAASPTTGGKHAEG